MDTSRRNLALWAIVCATVGAIGIAVAFSGGAPVSDGVPLVAPDGMTVVIEGSTNADLESFTPTSGTVSLTTAAGNATFFSSGSATAHVHKDEIAGPWTNVTQIDASTNTITINPEDKPAFVVGKQMDNVSIKDSFTLDDGTPDLVYGGASGESRLTIQGVPADTDIAAMDADTGNFLDSAVSDSSGQVTFDSLDNSKHTVLLQTSDFSDPVLSNPSPTGGLSSAPSQFEIDVNDSDFPDSDEVVVNITADSGSEYNVVDSEGDGDAESASTLVGDNNGDGEIRITPDTSGDVTDLNFTIDTNRIEAGEQFDVNIYIDPGQPDGAPGDGTLVKSNWSPPDSAGPVSIDLDTEYTISAGQDYSVEWVLNNHESDGGENDDILINYDGDSTYTNGFYTSGTMRNNPANLTIVIADDAQVTSQTLTSNGTVTASIPAVGRRSGSHTWTVEADPDFGNTVTETYTYSIPTNITIRQETNETQLVTGANVTLTMYSADATIVVEREDSDDNGQIDLEGLPDKEFVAVVDAEGYYDRRVYIDSIYEQQNIFLLNNTNVPPGNAINTTFVFEDRTGEFPPENTTLRVQRALDINDDGTSEWMTVAGDFWGAASEFPFTGERNARYRLIVENQQDDRRVLGTHIPTQSGVKTIINGQIRFEAGNATGRYFDANLSSEANNIQVLYQDPTDSTGDIRVRVWELGNQSNEIHDQNYTSSPFGRLFTTISITDDESEQSWVVRIDSETTDGETIELQVTVGSGLGIALPADPWLLAAFSVIALTFVGSMYGPRTATIGSWVLVAVATGLTAIGMIGIPIIGLIVAAVIAAGGTIYKEAVP